MSKCWKEAKKQGTKFSRGRRLYKEVSIHMKQIQRIRIRNVHGVFKEQQEIFSLSNLTDEFSNVLREAGLKDDKVSGGEGPQNFKFASTLLSCILDIQMGISNIKLFISCGIKGDILDLKIGLGDGVCVCVCVCVCKI